MEVNQENAMKIAKWYHQETTNLFKVINCLAKIIGILDKNHSYDAEIEAAKNKINRIQNIQVLYDHDLLLT
jgi:hypothetical protein